MKKKIGILGGGQLGRMLLQAAINYPVETYILEKDPTCPAGHLCHQFTQGDFRNYDDVYNFGRGLDAITIEIESVNADALEQLKSEGVRIYPDPATLKIIQNKIRQKEFYAQFDIPSAEFIITANSHEIHDHYDFLPAIHKLAEGGFDGRGVVDVSEPAQIPDAFDKPAVLEKKVDIHKEISIIIGKDDAGVMAIFPAVEMVFDATFNQLSYQISPADLEEDTLAEAQAIASRVVENLETAGIFAIEMFIDKRGKVLVNETAVRVHNSGHHTIEANYISQFDILWRIMLGYPINNVRAIMPSAMVNIIGDSIDDEASEKLRSILSIENTYIHMYGKTVGRAGRKMGHVTILNNERDMLLKNVQCVTQILDIKI